MTHIDHRNRLSLFILWMWIFWTAPPIQAEWAVPTADSRYRIELIPGSNTLANTGYFLLYPNDRLNSNTFIRVVSSTGTPLGHQILWSAEGEPMKVLFDCSSHASAFDVYTGPVPTSSPEWAPDAGLILETRKRAEGEPTNAAAIRTICNESKPVLGRSLIPDIFLGIHPHGPTADFASLIKGTFIITQAGEYGFATISEDASCLLVDGKIIAQWPGWHGYHEGRKGQHHGSLSLAPGPHQLEYLNIKRGAGYTIEAAWRPPGRDRFELIPATAFAPVAEYAVTRYEHAPASPPGARFTWQIKAHYTIDSATLVLVSFTPLTGGQDFTWEFDDGTCEHTQATEHVFLSPGMRTVKLTVQTASGKAIISGKILIHPQWTQEKEQPKRLFEREIQRLNTDEFLTAPLSDLVGVLRIAMDEEALTLVKKFASLCLARKADFEASLAGIFLEMGLFLQRHDLQEYTLAEQAFKMAEDSPLFYPNQKAWATLQRAGLLLNSLGRTEEARLLLNQIDVAQLTDTDQRQKKILEGDGFLAEGQLDLARSTYRAIGTTYGPGDTGKALKQQARLETARDYLRRGEFESAEKMLQRLEWESPEQRMATETGIVMMRIQIAQKEFRRALLWSRRLLPLAETDSRKSEILAAMTEIYLATDQLAEATTTYHQLLKNHPYSEAAARAKDRWAERFAK